ncbi:MAG: V-type ATP synthase subunit E [Sulfolobales archaeon]
MSLEDLRKTIIGKARAEAELIIREAKERAEKIIKEAEERKKELVNEERRRVINEAEFEVRLAEARREARLIVAKAKYEVVEGLRRRVWELIRGMSYDERLKSLENLLKESLEVLKSMGVVANELVVYVAPNDRKLMESLLGRLGIKGNVVEDSRISGGVVVVSGEVTVDNSYDTRLDRCLRELLPQLFRVERLER